jgi:hypothetical protein
MHLEEATMAGSVAQDRKAGLLHNPRSNRLLAALPAAEWQRLQPQLEQVDLPLLKVLYESGEALTHMYFPTTAIVALLYVLESGASGEIAVVGKRELWVWRCSWAVDQHPAAPWCKAQALASGLNPR